VGAIEEEEGHGRTAVEFVGRARERAGVPRLWDLKIIYRGRIIKKLICHILSIVARRSLGRAGHCSGFRNKIREKIDSNLCSRGGIPIESEKKIISLDSYSCSLVHIIFFISLDASSAGIWDYKTVLELKI